jgi:hypothetical protein
VLATARGFELTANTSIGAADGSAATVDGVDPADVRYACTIPMAARGPSKPPDSSTIRSPAVASSG